MSERSERIFKLKSDRHSRESYIKAKLGVLVPSQIRALRLKSNTPNQKDLAKAAGTHQSRLSMIEQPGEANLTLEKLAWIASVHKVGVIVKFTSFGEMLQWENNYSQDEFSVTRIDEDEAFLNPERNAEISSFQVSSAGNTSTFVKKTDDAIIKVRTSVPDKGSFKRSHMVP